MKKLFITIIKYLLVGAIFFFIGKYIYQNIGTLGDFNFHFNILRLSISFLLIIGSLFGQACVWHYITFTDKSAIPFAESLTSWAYSIFGKYIPGKVFGYAMLIYMYSKKGIAKERIAFCALFEIIAPLIAASFIFLISLFFIDIPIFRKYQYLVIVLLLVLFILIHPHILGFLLNRILPLFKRERIKMNIGYFHILIIVFFYIVIALIAGLAFYFFISSFINISFGYYFFLTGTFALSGIIGFLAFFAPAGLGVREGVITLALSEILPPSVAGVISLSSRIWITIGEILFLLIIVLLNKIFKARKSFVLPSKDELENS